MLVSRVALILVRSHPGPGPLPVVLALLAVVLQVCDVVVVAVGVVAAALTPDQTFDITGCPRPIPASLHLCGFRWLRLLGPGPAAGLHPVHHQHLADAVRAQVFHKLCLVLRLEVTRLAVERLLLLTTVSDAVFVLGVLLRWFGADWGAGLDALRQVLSLVRVSEGVFFRGGGGSVDGGGRGLWVLDDTELLVVLVVEAVPV